MSKPLTAETAAQEVAKASQPGLTFNGFDNLKQPVPLKKNPLPVDLARALGQS
jgi:hypothetical protein